MTFKAYNLLRGRRPYSIRVIFRTIILLGSLIAAQACMAQSDAARADTAYVRVLTERSAKIVQRLRLSDSAHMARVTGLLVDQYLAVNEIHARYKPAEVRKDADTTARSKREEERSRLALQRAEVLHVRHATFLDALVEELDAAGVEGVKDGMTYQVLPVTYAAYVDMLPALTTDQRRRVMVWLREARELAMDEGSSNAKHAVFGKYKGRINNYLSAEGYDLKRETAAWQQRINLRKTTN